MIDFKKTYSVHFVGIGGVSMHLLAEFCHNLGWQITGSDCKKNAYTKKLLQKRIAVFIGHKKSNIISPNFIVKSSAIKDDNPEIKFAKKLGIKIYDRAEFLAEITKRFKTVVAVAGAHGKSTTTAMICKILKDYGKKVSCHLGADFEDNRLDLKDDILVLEACEYNKSFLKFKVDIGIVLNVDKEHLDCYGSYFNLKLAFKSFLNHAKKRYVFSSKETNYLSKLSKVVSKPQIYDNYFEVENSKFVLDNSLGEQYVYDATMAITVCKDLGVDDKTIFETLKEFKPLKRRNELLATIKGIKIYTDYAHHPTELKYLIKRFGEKSLYIFQPHTFSRTKYLETGFINVFKSTNVIIFKEYSAREKSKDGKTAYELYEKIKQQNSSAQYLENEEELNNIELYGYENIIFVGAGDINEVGKRFSTKLSRTKD